MKTKSATTVKNVFRNSREEKHLTREKASELCIVLSPSRIEKIESEKSAPRPDEVLCLAKCYCSPELISHYCFNMCDIGKCMPHPTLSQNLSEIIINILSCSDYLEANKSKLIQMTAKATQADLNELLDQFPALLNILSIIQAESVALSIWAFNNLPHNDTNRI